MLASVRTVALLMLSESRPASCRAHRRRLRSTQRAGTHDHRAARHVLALGRHGSRHRPGAIAIGQPDTFLHSGVTFPRRPSWGAGRVARRRRQPPVTRARQATRPVNGTRWSSTVRGSGRPNYTATAIRPARCGRAGRVRRREGARRRSRTQGGRRAVRRATRRRPRPRRGPRWRRSACP